MWAVIDIDYIDYIDYGYRQGGNRNTQDNDAAMLRVLLLHSGGLLRLGTLQQADDLGVLTYYSSRQGSGPIILGLVDISSSSKQGAHHLHLTHP